jgi:hypothetical protein
MATMIPGGIEEFKTEGERRFYRFLESVAKPDQEFTSWSLPTLKAWSRTSFSSGIRLAC